MNRPPALRRLLAAAAVLALATAAAAAEPAQPERVLSLDQAVAIALERNHDLRRAEEALARVDGQIQEARSAVYPQLGLEADYFRAYDESIRDSDLGDFFEPEQTDRFGVRATARQLLFAWGKASTAIEIAQDARQQARWERDGVRREVKLRVHETFYGLLLAQRLTTVAEQTLEQRRRHLAVAEKRFAAGVANEFEVLRARVEVANAEPPVIRAGNRVRQAAARLNQLLARDPATPLTADGELADQPLEPPTLERTVARAVARRPELAALRVSREIAGKAERIARAGDKPEVNLLGRYGFASEQAADLGPDREVWQAGVALTWPLFDGGRSRGQAAQAASDRRAVEIAADQLAQAIAVEAKVVLDDLAEARRIIDAAGLNTERAERALELAETSYRHGVATALDVSDAELALSVARVDHARALHDYLVARARVLSVTDDL